MAKTIDEKIDELALSMAAGFEGVDKKFEAISQRLDSLEKKVATLPDKDYVDNKFSQLPDKAFVTDKLADVKGEIVLVVRREDKKVDFALDRLQQRGALTKSDVEDAHDKFQVFPSLG